MRKIPLIIGLFVLCAAAAALFWKRGEEKYKVLILWSGLGEYEWSKRLEKACKNLGWEYESTYCREEVLEEKWLISEPVSPQFIQKLIVDTKPDFTVSLEQPRTFSSKVPNYIALTGCKKRWFDCRFDAEKAKPILDFDGVLYMSPTVNSLKKFVEASGKRFHGIDWYPSCADTEYKAVAPKKLFYCGFPWEGDDKRNGEAYRNMFLLLDEQGYLEVYGNPASWSFLPHSIKGVLPFDGESVSKAIREAGIALVLHSQQHLDLEAPAARIFEAASSCAAIICDSHPFVMREFGDSVLYIDDSKSGEELFAQIDGHVKWILAHPKEAEAMARRAHAIFKEKFTLETQLRHLAAMHKQVIH